MQNCLVALVSFGQTSPEKIGRTLNRLKISYKVILPYETPNFSPSHIILSGGPKHVYEKDHYPMPQWVLNANVPVLGICYGMQLIAHTLGGKVWRMGEKEEGLTDVTEIVGKLQYTSPQWMNRYDQVISVPSSFIITGVTHRDHVAAFTDNKKWWAVQYHPEHNKYGDLDVFRRFLMKRICSSK